MVSCVAAYWPTSGNQRTNQVFAYDVMVMYGIGVLWDVCDAVYGVLVRYVKYRFCVFVQ